MLSKLKTPNSVEYEWVKLNRRYYSIDKIFNKSEVVNNGEYGETNVQSGHSESRRNFRNILKQTNQIEDNNKDDTILDSLQYSTDDLLLKPRKREKLNVQAKSFGI